MTRAELIQNNLKMIKSDDKEIFNLFIQTFYPTELTVKLDFTINKFPTGEFDNNTEYEWYNCYIILNVLDLETNIILYTIDYGLKWAEFYEIEDNLLCRFAEKFNLPDVDKFITEFFNIIDQVIYTKISIDFHYNDTNHYEYKNLDYKY